MRFKLGRGGHHPHKAAGFCLIAIGVVIMLVAMPFFFWLAAIGCLICYCGFCVSQNRF